MAMGRVGLCPRSPKVGSTACVCSGSFYEQIIRREYAIDWDNRACMNPTGYDMCGNTTTCLRSNEYCGQGAYWCAGQIYVADTPCAD